MSTEQLAINRDGAGDVSVVLLTPYIVPLDMELLAKNKESSFQLLDRLESVSAQFEYIAYVNIEYVSIEYVHTAYVNARADGFTTGVSPDVLDRSLRTVLPKWGLWWSRGQGTASRRRRY